MVGSVFSPLVFQYRLQVSYLRIIPNPFDNLVGAPNELNSCRLPEFVQAIKQSTTPFLTSLLVPNYFSHANSAFRSSIICS